MPTDNILQLLTNILITSDRLSNLYRRKLHTLKNKLIYHSFIMKKICRKQKKGSRNKN